MAFFIVYLQILNELYLGAIRKTTKTHNEIHLYRVKILILPCSLKRLWSAYRNYRRSFLFEYGSTEVLLFGYNQGFP